MASSSTSKFPQGERFVPSPANLAVGTVLPPNTFISGQTVILFPLNDDYPDTIRLRIATKYPLASSTANDYVAPSSTRQTRWKFNIVLGPTEEEKARWTNAKEAMIDEHMRLQGILGHDMKLAADGLTVYEVKGHEVQIGAKGSRMMWTESTGAWTMFQAPSQSTAPSWLRSPTLPPSSDLPSIPKSPSHPCGYRPITSLLPPKLTLRPSSDAYTGLDKRKRSISPRRQSAERNTSAAQAPKKTVVALASTSKSSTYIGRPAPTFGVQHPSLRSSSSIGHLRAEGDPTENLEPASAPALEPQITTTAQSPEIQLPAGTALNDPSVDTAVHVPSRTSHIRTLSPPLNPVKEPSPDPGPSMVAATRNARAEAEAAARARALRLQAVQSVEEEREREREDDLRRDRTLAGVRYSALSNLREHATPNVMGIVIRIDPPKRSKDFTVSLVITDPSIHTGEMKDEAIVVTIFRPLVEALPMAAVPGTPILFRGLKMRIFKDKIKGNAFSNDTNGWVYLLNGNQPKISDANALVPAFSELELQRLQALKQWWDTKTPGHGALGRAASAGVAYVDQGPVQSRRISSDFDAQGGQKIRCLGDLAHGRFSDIVFKIIHVAPGRTVQFELYVVDGTLSNLPLRNFHNVEYPRVGRQGVYCIGIQRCPPDEEHIYRVGNYVLLRNVRSKMYRDELELIWSELVTQQQDDAGWKSRKAVLIPPQDERALEIERRISGSSRESTSINTSRSSPVKREAPEDPSIPPKRPRGPSVPLAIVPAPDEPPVIPPEHTAPPLTSTEIPLASHVSTIHKDPIDHPTQTLKQVLANRTFPNKFRVRAKVQAVIPRRIRGHDSYAQKHCGRCNHAIVKLSYCQSCGDVDMGHASWQYRFVAILEDSEAIIPVLIQDEEAARFLPALPPLSASSNPNDARKTLRQLEGINKGVCDVLQGAPMDNVRPQPYIDWTIASCRVPVPKGYVGPHGEREVVVWKAFGMAG